MLIIASSIGFGLSPTFANFAYDSGASVVGTLLTRFCTATLLMLLVRRVSSKETSWPKPKLFAQIFLLGAFGYFIATLLYFAAPSSVAMDFPKNVNGWISVILLATVATVIPTATLYSVMQMIGTGKTAVLQTFEPVSSIVAGVLFLGESLTLARIIGAVFVIGAVGTLAASETRNKTEIPH